MNLTEIKKELYKQKPIAKFGYIRKGLAIYSTNLNINEAFVKIVFEIPFDDMGDATFNYEMDAKSLIRWITIFDL